MLRQKLGLFFLMLLAAGQGIAEANCPAWLNVDMRLLRSEQSKNLCAAYAGKPMLIVNTASHCGFTKQFKGLEALNQQYKSQGLVIVGFPSDDFNQEAKNEEETATVCYANFGVTFDMFAPIAVRGDDAHPIFKELAKQGGGAPKWNFYKYLVNRRGEVVQRFSSIDAPDSDAMRKAVEAVLAQP